MNRVLVVAEHVGGKLNAAVAKCVSCARQIPDAEIAVAVFAADGDAVSIDAWDRTRRALGDAPWHRLTALRYGVDRQEAAG